MMSEEKWITTYEVFIHRWNTFVKALDQMSLGYLAILLISLSQLKQILHQVTVSIRKVNLEYILLLRDM